MVLNDKEKEAIQKKMDNPDDKVDCPRCGSELEYFERGNSIAIICKTKGCICGGLRGI